jgi:hypothetical protein
MRSAGLRGHWTLPKRTAAAMATAATAVVWPLGKLSSPNRKPSDERLEDQLGHGDCGKRPDDGEQHARPSPSGSSSACHGGDQNRRLCRISQADQDIGDGLIPEQPILDHHIQDAVHPSRLVLIGIPHPQSGDHGDRQHDDGYRRPAHPSPQQGSVTTRHRPHRSRDGWGQAGPFRGWLRSRTAGAPARSTSPGPPAPPTRDRRSQRCGQRQKHARVVA